MNTRLIIIGLSGLAFSWSIWFWTHYPQSPQQDIDRPETAIITGTDHFFHCFSTDGRINYVIVKSDRYPKFLPLGGNEKSEYYCNKEDVIDYNEYAETHSLRP